MRSTWPWSRGLWQEASKGERRDWRSRKKRLFIASHWGLFAKGSRGTREYRTALWCMAFNCRLRLKGKEGKVLSCRSKSREISRQREGWRMCLGRGTALRCHTDSRTLGCNHLPSLELDLSLTFHVGLDGAKSKLIMTLYYYYF